MYYYWFTTRFIPFRNTKSNCHKEALILLFYYLFKGFGIIFSSDTTINGFIAVKCMKGLLGPQLAQEKRLLVWNLFFYTIFGASNNYNMNISFT